jgi:hypothetical protein
MDRAGAHADARGTRIRTHEFLSQPRPEDHPAAPATAFAHRGAGSNIIYVDPEHDIVAVVRWIQGSAMNGFIEKLLGAVRE